MEQQQQRRRRDGGGGTEEQQQRRRWDGCSFTEAQDWTTRHLALTLHVDFPARRLRARVALTVEALRDGLSSLTLDTRDLKITKATSNGLEAKFSLGDKHSFKGTPLTISLPFELLRGQQAVVEVSYETSPEASALQWLTAEQTAGKKHPYLFSQCQAIHCRSMVPCQDTPSVKSTYSARVSVPKELVALMSANRDGELPDNLDESRKIYCFRQTVPIPSYLIALVVGCLESRVIGPRSRVWSEKEMVDAAAYEFEETETMLKTAENLVGAYVWGQYDLLVLPPSFPYGGMENPCLTFVTPTLLAGDRSLSNVIAHEISHSWTGNLVTNKTWEHFWLNEGHTVYLERMIAHCMCDEKLRQFVAIGGWKDLLEAIKTFGPTNPLTSLVPDLRDTDPDDAFSSVPYEKGFALLYHLEELLGGPEIFMGFLKFYIQTFAYSALTTEEWKKCLYSYFSDKTEVLNQVDWNAWFHSPGIPPFTPHYDTALADACVCLCKRWTAASDSELSCFSEVDLKQMSSQQKIEFLSLLLLEPPLRLNSVKRMQEVYKFNDIRNAEIKFRWLRLCLRSQWEKAIPLALEMVTVQGRMKFTRPLYRDLYNFEKARQQAIDTFMKNKPSMHPITAALVAKDLHLA
ncbi:leukotriene A-4 hydrolase [Pristis pectinata]|uniref:leukotriene A-4 hydrolase n=1 Tax=Pristis pectinata TaxID=685728 RepID=UPI00223E09A1|nr:leukotriene A-4 hydrolase [Pristis pectinata]